jgi:hypothetical protein
MENKSPLTTKQKIILYLSLILIMFLMGLTNTIFFSFGVRFTVGEVIRKRTSSGASVWELRYRVSNEKYYVPMSIDIHNPNKVKIGDKYAVKFSEHFPRIAEVVENLKLADSCDILPSQSWTDIKHICTETPKQNK